jgi:plastocyanin
MTRAGSNRILVLFLIFVVFVPPVSSHDASALTTNIKQLNVEPNTANILLGDSIYWINLDKRENVTHRIVHDSDGDGLFNGTDDWDSGTLLAWTSNGTCIDETGNKTPNCAVTYEIYFNDTSDIGTYEYTDLIYENETLIENRTFTVIVKTDSHMDAINTYCFGDDCDDDKVEELTIKTESQLEKPYWLLYVSGGTGFLALFLGLKLLFSPSNLQFTQEE